MEEGAIDRWSPLIVRYPRGDQARPMSGERFEWLFEWGVFFFFLALGLILAVSLRRTLQVLVCTIPQIEGKWCKR